MLKGCPGIRESGDLGQQDSVPQIAPSVFSPAASGPGCDDSAPGAAAVAASGLQGGAAMARDNSANVSSETWAGGARPSGPQKLRVSSGHDTVSSVCGAACAARQGQSSSRAV